MAPAALLAGLLLAAARPAPPPVPQPRLEDFMAPPGTTRRFEPFMRHADLWVGVDQRAKLDTIVFVLDNGARCFQVLDRDSTWAVDYTWVYPHGLLPPRWYDMRDLVRTGDSLRLADDAQLQFTFATLRTAVRATSPRTAEAEAYRLWPREMPRALRGRLEQKLDRARKALAGQRGAEAVPPGR